MEHLFNGTVGNTDNSMQLVNEKQHMTQDIYVDHLQKWSFLHHCHIDDMKGTVVATINS